MILLAPLAAAGAPSIDLASPPLTDSDTTSFGLDNPSSVTVTAEGNIALTGLSSNNIAVLSGSTLAPIDVSYSSVDEVYVATHPSGNLVVVDQGTDTVALLSTASLPSPPLLLTAPVSVASVPAGCSGDTQWPVVQRTGAPSNAAIFAACSSTIVCRYSAMLTGSPVRLCKTDFSGAVDGIELAPDDSFLLAWQSGASTLHKLSATDLSLEWSVDVAPLTTASAFSLISSVMNRFAVRSDLSVVLPDEDSNQLVILDVSGAGAPATALEVPLPSGCEPEDTYVHMDGTGDVVVLCDGDDTYFVVDENADVASGVSVSVGVLSPGLADPALAYVGDAFMVLTSDASDAVHVYGVVTPPTFGSEATQSQTQTQSPSETASSSETHSPPLPGVLGDPILVDIFGTRFLAGMRGRSEYLLYESGTGADRITMTTGMYRGKEHGFFVRQVAITRSGCGRLVLSASDDGHGLDQTGPSCFRDLTLAGDDGMVVYSLESQTAAIIMPHATGYSSASHQDGGFGFLNIRFAGLNEAFTDGCRGMLCDGDHADQLAL